MPSNVGKFELNMSHDETQVINAIRVPKWESLVGTDAVGKGLTALENEGWQVLEGWRGE